MSYSVKLKDQTGSEITYNSVEQVALPKSSGNGNAHFVAQYTVTKSVARVSYIAGGNMAANSVDYMCHLTGNVPEAVTVTIGGNVMTADDYTYNKVGDTNAIVHIIGSSITGDIVITASA